MSIQRQELQQTYAGTARKLGMVARFNKTGDTLRVNQSRHEYKSTVTISGDVLFLDGQIVHGSFAPPSLFHFHIDYWTAFARLFQFKIIVIKSSCHLSHPHSLLNSDWQVRLDGSIVFLFENENLFSEIHQYFQRIRTFITTFMENEPLAQLSWDDFGTFNVAWHGARFDNQVTFMKDRCMITPKDDQFSVVEVPIEQLEQGFEKILNVVKSKFRLPNLMDPKFQHFRDFMSRLTRNGNAVNSVLMHLQSLSMTPDVIEQFSLLESKKRELDLYEHLHQNVYAFAFRFGDWYIHVSSLDELHGTFDIISSHDLKDWIEKTSHIFRLYIYQHLTDILKEV